MNVQYKDAIFHPVLALIMIKLQIQSALQTVVFKKGKLPCTLKIKPAWLSNNNFQHKLSFLTALVPTPLYNKMVKSYGTCNSNKQPAQFWFDRLKTDQDFPVYYVYKLFGQLNRPGTGGIKEEIIAKRANTSM